MLIFYVYLNIKMIDIYVCCLWRQLPVKARYMSRDIPERQVNLKSPLFFLHIIQGLTQNLVHDSRAQPFRFLRKKYFTSLLKSPATRNLTPLTPQVKKKKKKKHFERITSEKNTLYGTILLVQIRMKSSMAPKMCLQVCCKILIIQRHLFTQHRPHSQKR